MKPVARKFILIKHPENTTNPRSTDEILSLVDGLCKGLEQKPIIVLTGGEPLIWHQNENFINLVRNLLINYEVHFETNGTILVDFDKFKALESSSVPTDTPNAV